jgi:YesN/AraC family two-component response regulator
MAPQGMSDENPFYIDRRIVNNYHDGHVHDCFEMLYLTSGQRLFFINDRTFKVKEGDLILIHPNVLHKATSNEALNCEGILVYFFEKQLSPLKPLRQLLTSLFKSETTAFSLSLNACAFVDELFSKMLQEYRSKNQEYLLAMQAYILELLIFLSRNIKESQATSFEHLSPVHEKVSDVAGYINQHYSEALSLNFLAGHFYISPNYLCKVFKEVTDFTLIEYLNNVRVKEAKRLLLESREKVVDIAEKVGFGSITNFGRVFKEITGHPPLYYRKLGK